jgi:hypothetical protein
METAIIMLCFVIFGALALGFAYFFKKFEEYADKNS